MYKKYIYASLAGLALIIVYFVIVFPEFLVYRDSVGKNDVLEKSISFLDTQIEKAMEKEEFATIKDAIPIGYDKSNIYYAIEKNTSLLNFVIDSINIYETDESEFKDYKAVKIELTIKAPTKNGITNFIKNIEEESRLYILKKYSYVYNVEEYTFRFIYDTYYR